MVAQHHAQFGLAIVVKDSHREVFREPADHLRVQRLASAANGPQFALDPARESLSRRDQQAIGRRRTGEIADAVFLDHPTGTFHGERAIIEGDRMAQTQWPGDTEIQTIGPARIGDVPERVFRTQVHRIAGVALEGNDRLERYFQRLGRAGGARGEHQQERLFTAQHHRFATGRIVVQLGPEAEVAAHNALPARPANGDDGWAIADFAQLGAVDRIGHHHLGCGTAQAVLDGLGAESGEQRLIDGTDAPGGEQGHQQLDIARQQPSDLVATAYALGQQKIGETPGPLLQLAEGIGRTAAVAAFPEQRDPPRQGMPLTAFDAGVERRQSPLQGRIDRVLIVKVLGGSQVVAHNINLSLLILLLEGRGNRRKTLEIVAPSGTWDNGQSLQPA